MSINWNEAPEGANIYCEKPMFKHPWHKLTSEGLLYRWDRGEENWKPIGRTEDLKLLVPYSHKEGHRVGLPPAPANAPTQLTLVTNPNPEILLTLKLLNDLYDGLNHICRNGSCFQLYLLLKHLYPQAVAYEDSNHVITEIDGCFYDIRGAVLPDGHRRFDEDPRRFNEAYFWGVNNENDS